MKLPESFYVQQDVVQIAKDLLGKYLYTSIDGVLTSGIITETEAYAGITDKASHAYGDRRTPRTEVMYHQGGLAYIYLCYGMYSLFNVVTNVKGIPHAVLIRAMEPKDGIEAIKKRCNQSDLLRYPINGPGKLCKALGIHYSLSGTDLQGHQIWIEDKQLDVNEKNILISSRIGIAYAKEDALLPYRFILKYSEIKKTK